MSRAALLADVQEFVGKSLNDCIDRIRVAAMRNRFSVEVHDPDINTNDINRDNSRLDVFQDSAGRIVGFGVG